LAALRLAARQAATGIDLDEAATRLLIDGQLRQAGWEADSQVLRYSQSARPEKHRNLAIAEWPTRSGPADYVLFVGLTPVAAVEAKRANKDVAGVLPQAERYSRDFQPSEATQLSGAGWGEQGEFQLPFAFSCNGRPFLQQLRTASGIWFRDLRRATNLATPLEGWYAPEGLRQLARQDIDDAEAKLRREAFTFGFPLRPYQRRAIDRSGGGGDRGGAAGDPAGLRHRHRQNQNRRSTDLPGAQDRPLPAGAVPGGPRRAGHPGGRCLQGNEGGEHPAFC
jgi:type I restriction enzyme R subunit